MGRMRSSGGEGDEFLAFAKADGGAYKEVVACQGLRGGLASCCRPCSLWDLIT